MTNHRPWAELRAKIDADPARRARIEAGGRGLDDGLALVRLRTDLGLPEYEIDDENEDEADGPGDIGGSVSQAAREPHREDVYVATLRDFIESIGGRLEINAVFPDATLTLLPDRRWAVQGAADAERSSPSRGRVAVAGAG